MLDTLIPVWKSADLKRALGGENEFQLWRQELALPFLTQSLLSHSDFKQKPEISGP